ncbi:hypothetical protein NDU88_002233 [Pleurodeles waltl]|uniref:Uncharacterized protein n=1 Tax=Pleurodeles waltl TaxID=8319 RepID=A0AAV7SCM6_PLEWA|nr:hypothetical protein NDU88_002233 [Pleurodeles waltl]
MDNRIMHRYRCASPAPVCSPVKARPGERRCRCAHGRLLCSLCAGAAGAGGWTGAARLCWSAAAAEGRLSRLRVRSGRTQRKLGVPIELPGL